MDKTVLSIVPLNLARESPIGNPFLGKQRSPSWVQHMHNGGEKEEKDSPPTFTLAIISRRSCKRAGHTCFSCSLQPLSPNTSPSSP